MEWVLASLALHPEVTISFFSIIELDFAFDVNLLFFGKAILTDHLIFILDNLAAMHALGFYHSESTQAPWTFVLRYFGLVDGSSVVTTEEGVLSFDLVSENGLEYSD